MSSQAVRQWTDKDGVISLEVTSDSTIGREWIAYMEKKGIKLAKPAKDVLRSPQFKPTNGVTSRVKILKAELFSRNDLIAEVIRAEAEKRKLKKPNAEIACLFRKKFTNEEIEAMGLCDIIVMHEPISSNLLSVFRHPTGPWMGASYDGPDCTFYPEDGFAFVE